MEKSHSEIMQSLAALVGQKGVGAKDKHQSWLARIDQIENKLKRKSEAARSDTPRTPDNPSREAMARVRDPLRVPTICRYCGGRVECAHHNEVYGREHGDWPWVYRCTQCDARVGLHRETDIPLGTLANPATREARNASKQEFQQMQKELHLPPHYAYQLLAEKLDIARESCHFGWFDIDMCVAASRAIYEVRKLAGVLDSPDGARKGKDRNEGGDLPLLFEGQRKKSR
jgi:hypothetical protein